MNSEILQNLLADAETKHAQATHPEDIAYWQGRKDAYRTLLAEALNDTAPLEQIASSVFHHEKAVRDFVIPEFVPVPDNKNCGTTQCLECGGTYFHSSGCQHGLGLSAEQVVERLAARAKVNP